MFVFGVGDFCKLLWGMGLKKFPKMGDSKIVPTHFMSFLVLSVKWLGFRFFYIYGLTG